jgi:restriction system protein
MNFDFSVINILAALLVVFVLLFVFAPSLFYFSRHERKIQNGRKILAKLQTFSNPTSIISYLRKIDPFVFEELLLSAFQEKGFRVKRNRKYTGDGGIDGQVFKNKVHYLVQAKRYSGYVSAKHIEEFSKVVIKKRADVGLFVHTGKTGKSNFDRFENVKIVSGEALVRLILVDEE